MLKTEMLQQMQNATLVCWQHIMLVLDLLLHLLHNYLDSQDTLPLLLIIDVQLSLTKIRTINGSLMVMTQHHQLGIETNGTIKQEDLS